MNYGLGSDDQEELAYYNKIKKDMDDMKKDSIKKGIPLNWDIPEGMDKCCLLYTSPSPRDMRRSRMPSSA